MLWVKSRISRLGEEGGGVKHTKPSESVLIIEPGVKIEPEIRGVNTGLEGYVSPTYIIQTSIQVNRYRSYYCSSV